jgi:hypothetical protein
LIEDHGAPSRLVDFIDIAIQILHRYSASILIKSDDLENLAASAVCIPLADGGLV